LAAYKVNKPEYYRKQFNILNFKCNRHLFALDEHKTWTLEQQWSCPYQSVYCTYKM